MREKKKCGIEKIRNELGDNYQKISTSGYNCARRNALDDIFNLSSAKSHDDNKNMQIKLDGECPFEEN